MALTAVILAGGPHDPVAALEPGAVNKAFVRFDGTELVARVIASLRDAEAVGRIIAVAPVATFAHPALASAPEHRPAGPTMAASLGAGLADLPPDEFVLIVAADLPLLSARAVDDFVARARQRDADLAYACVERTAHTAAFPGVRHTWARLREGVFCGGGCVLLRPRVLGRLERFLGRLGAARKSPLRLAAIFGVPTLARYATGRLTLADAERRASQLVRFSTAAIASPYAEIAINIDRPTDIDAILRAPRSSA